MANANHENNVYHSTRQPPSGHNRPPRLALGIAALVGFAVGLLLGLVIGALGSGSSQQAKRLEEQSGKLAELSREIADLKAANENPSRAWDALEPGGNLDEQAEQLAEVSDRLADLRIMGEELSRTLLEDKPKRTHRQRGPAPPQPDPSPSQPAAARPQPEHTAPQPKEVSSPRPESAPKPEPTPPKYPLRRLQMGNVRIRIPKVVVGRVPLWDKRLGVEKKSEKEYLTVWLELENVSGSRRLQYRSWMSEFAAAMDIGASLTDDDGNAYALIGPKLGLPVLGTSSPASIAPSKTIKEALVFETPAKEAEQLRLVLSAKAFGEKGQIPFRIPMSIVTSE